MRSAAGIEVAVTGAVATFTFNRPDLLNAIDPAVLQQLENQLGELERDRNVRTLILTGRGRAFVAGADVRYMRDLAAEDGRAFVEVGHRVLDRLADSRIVSIAAINGYALGGGAELALACDLRIAASTAQIGFPEVRLGLFPAWGGTQRLARLIGPGRARLMVFTAERLTADQAFNLGLVERVVAPVDLMSTCTELAHAISEAAPQALEQAKRALVEGVAVEFAEGKRIEREAWLVNFATADRIEGLAAFLEKRAPHWSDR
jgi:enoyl-CoA hydratase/carnithine racemase